LRRYELTVVLALAALGCGGDGGPAAGSQDTTDDGAAAEIEPMSGRWEGGFVAFELDGQAIRGVELASFGCVGELTPAKVPLCTSLLTGPLEVEIPVDGEDHFRWETAFGLILEGTFSEDDRLTGTFSYTADNGCCAAEGTWLAVHESIAETDAPEPCHAVATGAEEIVVGITVDGAFQPLVQGEPIQAVEGFQSGGAIMVVGAVRVRGMSIGSVTAAIEVEIPEVGVHSEVTATDKVWKAADDGGDEWIGVLLQLLHADDTPLLPIEESGDIALIAGKTAVVRARISNACGFYGEAEVSGPLQYE
jgi:hypothetical protein